MQKINRLGWAAGLSFTSHGRCYGVRVSDACVLEQLAEYLPPGWKRSRRRTVEYLYSLVVGGAGPRKGVKRYHLAYSGAARIARTMDQEEALQSLQSVMQLTVAAMSTEGLFIHAGVVGWKGRAIVIPGRSHTGKTSLVAALLEAGATYYSDEYAILDDAGRVRPYPRLLSVRENGGRQRHCAAEDFGAEIGTEALPVGLIVSTRYREGVRWRPRALARSRAMMELFDNTVAARIQRQRTLPVLHRAVLPATAIKGSRPEAEAVVPDLLRRVAAA